ncbi:TP53-regulated inhibitor of apoptosis 1 [Pseudolycoriella hygida]|uniref:TP53-regulated inhibitor of apoptosis 1 n=1 Tax=Pseudolycoriella hygida TaxID=35572 RepID=A0A9Q0NFJ7_9DIPT|nr:TP53-regulated inhibitor of apoptosis 1 [Pseudolycoriella hygida]
MEVNQVDFGQEFIGEMKSIGENCDELKKQYDACFNTWFAEKFLKGKTDDSVCAPIFKIYQQCVKDAMRDQQIEFKEIDSDHLGSDKEFKKPTPS